MKVLEVSARKGGVGTSTVAVSLAVALSQGNPDRVLLVDTVPNADTWAIAGLPSPVSPTADTTFGDHNLIIKKASHDTLAIITSAEIVTRDIVVVDAGQSTRSEYFGVQPFRVSVVTNSYLSLRAHTFGNSPRPDAVVCLHDSENVLTRKDVENVLNQGCHFFAVDKSVARAIDAGVYASARTHLFAEWTSDLILAHSIGGVVVS